MRIEFICLMTRRGVRRLINERFGFNDDFKGVNIEAKIFREREDGKN